MKKFTISMTTTAALLTLAACNGGENDEANNGNNLGGENNQEEEVNEEPEVDMADNNKNDNEINNNDDLETNDETNELNNDMDEEESEAVMDQDVEDFDLNVTLVDDSQWTFTYTPAENEDDTPDATVSGDDLELEGEEAAEEMEAYLSDFMIDAASDEEEVLTAVADTFDFSEEDIESYDLTIDFPEHEDATEWSWQAEDDGEGNDENDVGFDTEDNNE
ncbi:YusW family protein [Alkalicoccus luteus]|uniref:YusW-like protein n=1 Tax=Alkalicoccus luteus TaxID=1237094 RepID=A0A969PQQ5_9BACI|nr:YusW family protein [Alkalicoccus luteus]NJP38637.1 hypothetical protein [Alkalicoccus luteus]